jgi:hypothetical protein
MEAYRIENQNHRREKSHVNKYKVPAFKEGDDAAPLVLICFVGWIFYVLFIISMERMYIFN